MGEEKYCPRCDTTKPIVCFIRSSGKIFGYCAECERTYAKEYRIRKAESIRNSKLKLMHGITLEHYNKILNKQNGVCAICKCKETSKKYNFLPVDHCHKTDTVRGLLCSNCNVGLGMFKDNITLLQSAIEYLSRNPIPS